MENKLLGSEKLPEKAYDRLRSDSNVSGHVECKEDVDRQQHVLFLDGDFITGYASLLILEALFAVVHRYEAPLETREPLSSPNLSTGVELELGESDPAILSIDWAGDGAPHKARPKVSTLKVQRTRSGPQEIAPCHYFDFIVGRGAAGLVSIMLGRLRMTLREATSRYVKLFEFMHASQKHVLGKKKINVTCDVKEITDCVVHGYSKNEFPDLPFVLNPGLSRTIILATGVQPGTTRQHLIRSYQLPVGKWDPSYENMYYLTTQKVCEVCLAEYTTAKTVIAGKTPLSGQILDTNVRDLVLGELKNRLESKSKLATVFEIQKSRKSSGLRSLPFLGSDKKSEESHFKGHHGGVSQDTSYAGSVRTFGSTVTADSMRTFIEEVQARLVLSFGSSKDDPKSALGTPHAVAQIDSLVKEFLSQESVQQKLEAVAYSLVQGRQFAALQPLE